VDDSLDAMIQNGAESRRRIRKRNFKIIADQLAELIRPGRVRLVAVHDPNQVDLVAPLRLSRHHLVQVFGETLPIVGSNTG
jgi:hypothetical protein